ncbi:bile salt-activated lipase, partial [Suricata suricatta]|uniref:bile salt-activated lipase n=1 Tax=Suricata suricatta TaxID=37032 RepID=UPI001155D886
LRPQLGAVYTEGGFVEGVNKKLSLFGNYVDIFKGIPFAAAPKPLENPQRHPGWQGTLKAKDFKKRCLQATITQDSTYGEEDCLYLNIWVPQGKREVSRNLPVMVWIYGGAFLMGAGHGANFLSNYLYDGEEIATRGNVIVVTFNYRVGPLGFLSTGDANLPGLLAVLGTGLTGGARGCQRCVSLPLSRPDPMLHYLGFVPVIDGDFIPDDPVNLYANTADIDYMAGTNNMDGHIFASIDMPAINKDKQEVTKEDFYKLVSGLTITKGPRGANTTFDLYAEPWALDAPQETKKKTVVDFETDILFLVPTRIALAQHRANAKSAKTYTYLFSHPSRMPVYPKWVGADHADDIQYVFGKPFATPLGYRSQDRTVSKAMIAYWTNFARSGDPNMGHSAVPTHWAPYTVESDNYLEINRKIDGSSMKQHLRTDYLRYWTLTYQALPTVTGDGAPAPPSGDSDAAPAPPSGDSDAAPAPPSGDSDAAPAPPSGDSDAAPAPPSGDSDAAPAPPSGDSDAAPAPPSGDLDAAPAPPSGDSEGAQMPAAIGF